MPKTVMIVDDYADARSMMNLLIRQHGYDVIEAADGYEAVEKSIQLHPVKYSIKIKPPSKITERQAQIPFALNLPSLHGCLVLSLSFF